ncbi:MAG: HAD family hydrolase [Planctomycetota bacterium]
MDLVVFDVAGTTLRDDGDVVARRMAEALASSGVEIGLAEVNPVMGLLKPLAIATLLESKRGHVPQADEVAEIHERFRSAMVEHYATDPQVAPMPGASEVFEELRRRGIRVALDTGFDRTILDAVIDRLGWSDMLDATIASDEVERGRPHPDMIHALMHRLDVGDVSRVCKVGDSLADIEEGVNTGCGLVVAIRNARTESVLGRFPGVAAIDHLGELLAHIDARSGVRA